MRQEGDVSVTLLLKGGHSRTLHLQRRDPLLTSLISSINDKSHGGGRPARPFTIRVDGGRSSIMFSSSDLVGLVTDPPLPSEAERPAPSLVATARRRIDPAGEKSPYLLLENFVDATLSAELLKFVLAHEAELAAAAGGAPALPGFAVFSDLIRDTVRSLVPQLATAFGLGDFPVGEIDCALAAQRDGAALGRPHQEGAGEGAPRMISYLFCFHGEPRSFSGGAFRLYGGHVGGRRPDDAMPMAEIEPKNNSILLFPSDCPHEVLPLCCPSNRFADGRFAVYGAVRRAG